MSDHEETYDRGDLSGIVFDISGDMVKVRLLDGRVIPGARLVTTPSGLLKIDATGLPIRRGPTFPSLEPVAVEPSEVEARLREALALPAPGEDVVEGSAEEDSPEACGLLFLSGDGKSWLNCMKHEGHDGAHEWWKEGPF